MSTVNRAISLQKYFIIVRSWASQNIFMTEVTIQWSVSRVRLLILCEILLAGCWWSPCDLTWVCNYQVLHKLSVRADLVCWLHAGRNEVIIKTNKHYLQSYHHIRGQRAPNHYQHNYTFYESVQSISPVLYQHINNNSFSSFSHFLPSSPVSLSQLGSPSQQNLISITKISPQIIWHIISWKKSRSDTSTQLLSRTTKTKLYSGGSGKSLISFESCI